MKPALALLLATAPGLYAWWGGRRLVRLSSDPALPERFLGHRLRVGQAAAVSAALMLVLLRPHGIWALPLMIAGVLGGGFPARRAILQERWGLGAYMAHVIRVATAGLGFWLLLALTPALIPDLGPARWPLAVLLAILLLTWNARYPEAFLDLTRATPLKRQDVRPGLDEVARRSRVPRPRLFRVGAPGGRWANAFALPSLRGSAVVFTDTLLEQFTPDEIAAVFAHEVAHLEHFDRRRLRVGHAVVWTAVATATLAIPLARTALGPEGVRLDWAWALVVGLSLAFYGTHHRAHEAESDRRAVALCGDPETLVRTLVKLHALARLPRRWGPEMEQRATHPSLAHRVQAIRAAAGMAAAGLAAPVLMRSTQEGRRVVLDPARVHWLEGVPADAAPDPATQREQASSVLSVPYDQLTDLRVRATLAGPPRLVAADRSGRHWSVPLPPGDVAAVQAVLDLLEGRLARQPVGWAHHPALSSLLATLTLLAAVVAGQMGPVLIPGFIGMFRPSQGTIAALGATSVATGLLALRQAQAITHQDMLAPAALAGLVVFGMVALAIAWRRARAERERRWRSHLVTAALLALGAAVAWAGLFAAATTEPRALRLHQAAVVRPSATIALVGVAAALAFLPRPAARWGALGLALLALAPVVMGSRWFLERFARDPFLARPPVLALRALEALPVREARVGGHAVQLRVSPSTLRFAVRPLLDGPEEDAQRPRAFSVRSFSGPEREIRAEDLRFLNDLRVLALVRAAPGLELRAVSLEDARDPSWARALPDLATPLLELDAALGTWRVIGASPYDQATVVLSGRVGADGVQERRWQAPAARQAPPTVLASEEAALGVHLEFERRSMPLALLAGIPFAGWRTEVWALGPQGPRPLAVSGLEVTCAQPPIGHGAAAFSCASFDGERTVVWSVDARSGRLEPVASLPGHVYRMQSGTAGRLLGWTDQRGLVSVDLVARAAARIELPAGARPPFELAAVGDSVVALAASPDTALVTVYQLAR